MVGWRYEANGEFPQGLNLSNLEALVDDRSLRQLETETNRAVADAKIDFENTSNEAKLNFDQFLNKHPYLTGVLLIVPGIGLGFFGSVMLDWILMFIGFAVGFYASMRSTDFIIGSIFKTTVSEPVYIGCMVLCCFIGISFGFCVRNMRGLAMGCLGGAFGYMLGGFLLAGLNTSVS
jgi:hypothetical protein